MSSTELDDPDYIRFLSHLRPDSTGRAYVLRIRGGPTVEYETVHDEEEKKKKEEDEVERRSIASWSDNLVTDNTPVDGDFLAVLKNLKEGEGSVPLDIGNNVVAAAEYFKGKEVKQEEEEEEEEEEEAPLSSSHSSSFYEHYNGDNDDDEEDGGVGDDVSSFKSKLMSILREPFDHREYKRLMKLASVRKPMVKFKHLRADDIPYETDQLGSSYFHYYPELKRKVERADRLSGLKLLRGFFFWLENVEHEGAYKPWLSASSNCRILPSR